MRQLKEILRVSHTERKKMLKIVGSGTSLVVKTLCSNAGDAILIPGQGTNIPPVTQPKNKKKKNF